MWNGFVNAIKNAVNTVKNTASKATSGWSAPKVSAPVRNVPSVNVSKPQMAAISKPSTPSVSISRPSAPSVSLSKPSTSFSSPLQSSGVKISLPSSSGPKQALVSNPISYGPQKPLTPGLTDLKNIGSGNFEKTLRGLTGLAGTGLTSLVKLNPVVSSAFNTYESRTGKNPLEFGISEAMSRVVKPSMANEVGSKKTISNGNPISEMSGGKMFGNTWVSNETLARNQRDLEEFRKNSGSLYKTLADPQLKVQTSEQMKKVRDNYNTGKITKDEYIAETSRLSNLGGIGLLALGDTPQSIDSSSINKSFNYTNLFNTDPNKSGQSSINTYNTEANNINSRIDNAVNNIIKQYENGNMSVDEANSKIAEAQKRELYSSRDRQINEANSGLTSLEADLQDYINQENIQTNRYKDEAAIQRAQKEATYGEMKKKGVKSGNAAEADLRNTFAALGTAESSSFMDKLMNLKGEIAGQQTGIDRQLGTETAALDKDVLNKVADSATRILTSKRTTQEQKDKVLQAIKDLSGSTDDKIFTLMADLASKSAAGKQNLANQVAALYSNQLANYTNQQNQVLQSSPEMVKRQYDATNGLTQMQSGTYDTGSGTMIRGTKRKTGMPQDMWDTAYSMMFQGINPTAVMNQLKQQAGMNPTWAPWIGTFDTILGTANNNIA